MLTMSLIMRTRALVLVHMFYDLIFYIMDSIEKIYCTGHDNNDALIAALANKNNDPMAMAALMN